MSNKKEDSRTANKSDIIGYASIAGVVVTAVGVTYVYNKISTCEEEVNKLATRIAKCEEMLPRIAKIENILGINSVNSTHVIEKVRIDIDNLRTVIKGEQSNADKLQFALVDVIQQLNTIHPDAKIKTKFLDKKKKKKKSKYDDSDSESDSESEDEKPRKKKKSSSRKDLVDIMRRD